MASKSKLAQVWSDIRRYHRVYVLTAVASFGGMLFGWDTGLIGGILTLPSFQKSFALDKHSRNFSSLQGNIVSVLQAGCFLGALSSFISDKFGRRTALFIADSIFLIGSVMQTCSGLNTKSLSLLYAGRVVGGFGVGLISRRSYQRTLAKMRTRRFVADALGRCNFSMSLASC